MKLVVLGLSLSSSWGNGHATTFRALLRALSRQTNANGTPAHTILFLERDVEWYASNRDLPNPDFCRLELYADFNDLQHRFAAAVRAADAVVVGSYVPEGAAVGRWVQQTAGGTTAFYDIDTPVTLAKLARGEHEYIAPDVLSRYDIYLSFSGGPALTILQTQWHARHALPLYCAVDTDLYFPGDSTEPLGYELGYLGTYSDDRQPTLDNLLLEPARRLQTENRTKQFIVAGPQYPQNIVWPYNVVRIEHLPPAEHRAFYLSQRFTLNVTRADMRKLGWSPSVRLFEAAACGTPIISDDWPGLSEFFPANEAILLANSAEQVLRYLNLHDGDREAIGAEGRRLVLGRHTATRRAEELVEYLKRA